MGEIPRGIFYAQIREGGADHAVQESERTGTVLVCIQILGPTSVSQKEVILCPESLRSLPATAENASKTMEILQILMIF